MEMSVIIDGKYFYKFSISNDSKSLQKFMEVYWSKGLKGYLYFVLCALIKYVSIQVGELSPEALCLKRSCFIWSRPAVHAALMGKALCCTVEICTPSAGLRKTANSTVLNVRAHAYIHIKTFMQIIRKENPIKHICTLASRPEISDFSVFLCFSAAPLSVYHLMRLNL